MLVKYEGIVNIFNKNIHKSHSWAFLGSHTIFKHDPLANLFIFRPVIAYGTNRVIFPIIGLL